MKTLLAAACIVLTQLAMGASTDPTTPPPEIVGKSWRAEDLNGKGVIDDARTYVRFETDTKASGSGAVNHFSAPCTIEGSHLTFGAIMSTKRAGAPALMNQERAFFDVLKATKTFKIDANGLLHLLGEDGKEIARLAKEDEPEKR